MSNKEDNEEQINYEEEDDLTDIEVLTETENDIEEDRSEISKLGLDNESDKAFTRLYNKSDQKEKKKEEKKPPPDFFLVK
ncbi:MAG: hypothetical protein ACTSPY_10715 [Candidatus Helarchaeota archaeon]